MSPRAGIADPIPAPPTPDAVRAIDWATVAAALDAQGCATVGPLLTADQCAALAAL